MKRQQSFYIDENNTIDQRKILSEREDFQSGIIAMREKWKIEMHYFISEDQGKILKKKEFDTDIRKLQQKLKIGKNFIPFLTEYAFLDMAVFAYLDGHTITIYEGTPPKKEGSSYFLELTEKTTKKDILAIWGRIETFIDGNHKPEKKKKEWKTFKRDRSIYRLARRGYSAIEIQRYIGIIHKQVIEISSILKAESRYREKMRIQETNKISLDKNKGDFFVKHGDSILESCFIEGD